MNFYFIPVSKILTIILGVDEMSKPSKKLI